MSAARPRRRWGRRLLAGLAVLLIVALTAFTALGGWGLLAATRGPATPFDPRSLPPAPDYERARAWLALPGRGGLERSTPPGVTAVDERTAPADVFFVHPTTFKGSPVWVAPYDASNAAAPLNPPVLLDQLSVFNGCCRLYAPRYRQATLAGLKNQAAVAVAYRDVARAFRYYLAHLNHGRPFILASHSQGTAHAVRLLQEEILGKPAQERMVAAYLIGGYVPDTFSQLGLPICAQARQTGCVLSYNTSEQGRTGAQLITETHSYWWRGRHLEQGRSRAICVNPLTWTATGAASAAANAGSLPFPQAPFSRTAGALPPPIPHLTGAVCSNRLLNVDVPWWTPGFGDPLRWIYGSFHLNDYGLFYAALRTNAQARVAAWREDGARHGND